jgi:hypothetical protein
MFIRPCYRRKNGKRHAYWALMESYRTERGPRQRVVAYLGQLGELFGIEYDLLLYDVTSTYFEGQAAGNPLAQVGHDSTGRCGVAHSSRSRHSPPLRKAADGTAGHLVDAPATQSTNTTSNGRCVVKTFRNRALLGKDLRQQLAKLG